MIKTGHKICNKCGVNQPLDNYNKSLSTIDKLNYTCKDCRHQAYLEVIVLRTCVDCGCFIQYPLRLHCVECAKNIHNLIHRWKNRNTTKYSKWRNRPKSLPKNVNARNREITQIIKRHRKKNFGRLIYDHKKEALGTYSTTPTFKQFVDNKVLRKKDGTPDWDRELHHTKILMSKTFSLKKGRSYTLTEGDIMRGMRGDD